MSGVSLQPVDGLGLSTAVVSATGTAIAAPAGIAGEIIRVYKLFLTVGGTSNITFEDGSTPLCGALPMVANGSISFPMDGQPWFTTSVGNAFTIANSGSAQVSGVVYYTISRFK